MPVDGFPFFPRSRRHGGMLAELSTQCSGQKVFEMPASILRLSILGLAVVMVELCVGWSVPAQPPVPAGQPPAQATPALDPNLTPEQKLQLLTAPLLKKVCPGGTPLTPTADAVLDKQGGRLLVATVVCLQEGPLEMLLTSAEGKLHEYILATTAPAYTLHGGLLALGAKPGQPVQFSPEFVPPQGTTLELTVIWENAQGELQRAPARDWMRTLTGSYQVEPMERLPAGLKLPEEGGLRFDAEFKELLFRGIMSAEQRDALLKLSGDTAFQAAVQRFFTASQPQPMQAEFVFAGSRLEVDERTKTTIYHAQAGDYICVANFSSAMIDVAEASSATGTPGYEAHPQRVPPLNTPVWLEIKPVLTDSALSGVNSPTPAPQAPPPNPLPAAP